MDFANMPAGREMDALIAEKVMGFRREKTPPDYNGEYGGEDILVPISIDHENFIYPPKGKIALTYFVPNYSTDIATAWSVAEKMHSLSVYRENNQWWSWFFDGYNDDKIIYGKASADTAPEAICRAALMAVGSVNNR